MKSLITILLFAFALATYSQPVAPILRMETGMHTAPILTMSIDALGKYILTGSSDKTARLWDAESGTLLKAFRIPIGSFDEGKIHACALSPDGKIAALGGYTGYEWDEKFSIYLINTQSGQIIYTIKNISNGVNYLKFSLDGQLLGAGLGDGSLHIYNSQNWKLLNAIKGFDQVITCLAFDKTNRIAAVSYDKTLRVFDNKLKLKSKIALEIYPTSVDFNDDYNLLVVGSVSGASVEVRNTTDLSLLYKPDDKDVGLQGAIFSKSNKKLYGWGIGNTNLLRVWDDYGKGLYKDVSLNFAALEIEILPQEKIAMVGFSTDVAVVNFSNITLWQKIGNQNIFDVNEDYKHFRINNSGTIIGFTPTNGTASTFDVLNRKLIPEQSSFPHFSDNNNITQVTSSNVGFYQMINKIPISFLSDDEAAHGVDINSDGTEVILIGNYALMKADDKANLIWKAGVPHVPTSVNISGNDNIVACTFADGTVRWFSMKDGKELLALYIDKSKERWVLFTPSGYYDASPGAEEMLGWHLNFGPDKTPDFYPVSRFKEKYYRPDIIDAIFETYNEEEAIALANSRSTKKIITTETSIRQKLPPTVIINSPSNGSNTSSNSVTINYAINSPDDAPAKNLRVLIDGRPVATERGLKPAASMVQKISVIVPSQDCVITLLAENDNGTSPETNLYLKWAAPAVVKDEFIYKPKLYVLAIGVSDYNNPELKLGFAAKDAADFTSAVNKQKGNLYGDVIVKKLTNKEATKDAMLDGLDWIQKQTGQKDMAMIFYAGHGINDNNGVFYMLPVAADLERIKATCMNFEDLKQTVSSIAGKVVVFIDACHSGNVMGSRRGGNDINAVVNELSSTENGAITFTSSTGKEFSLEDPAWGNGAFTKAVIEGLGGKAAINGKNKITIKSLDAYISERVKELTKGKQHPTSVSPPNVPDFPIAVTQ